MLEMKVFLPEDMIIRQGEEGREMYFISTGDCIVYVKDTQRQEKAVRKLTRGDFFGVILKPLTLSGDSDVCQVSSHSYC